MNKLNRKYYRQMGYLMIFFILGYAMNAIGQDLKTLENDIQQTVATDLNEIRKKANKIYLIDPYNEIATYYLATSYKYTKNLDSIPFLFTKLKNINSNSPLPYLLSAKYQFQKFSLSDTSRLAELKIAIRLDSTNFEAHYLLGVSYYSLFNQKHTNYYAFQSRDPLVKATQLEKSSLSTLKYPIIQISNFLNDTDLILKLENKVIDPITDSLNIPGKYTWYYPLTSFLDLKKNWQVDYSVDIIRQVSLATFVLGWYSEQLLALKEPLIFNQYRKNIYRFTWLRTFHNPIAIRLEKTEDSYKLYWKQTSGAGGYDPGALIVDSSKQLTKEQWDKFISLLQSTDFWNMPTISRAELGNDGSQWIIEGMENGKYHVVDRWSPSKSNYHKCGRYLIELTELKIKEGDLY